MTGNFIFAFCEGKTKEGGVKGNETNVRRFFRLFVGRPTKTAIVPYCSLLHCNPSFTTVDYYSTETVVLLTVKE